MLLRRISLVTILILCVGSTDALADLNSLPSQLQAQNAESSTTPKPSKIIQELGLTKEQITQLNDISSRLSNPIEAVYKTWDKSQQELEELMSRADASESQVRQKYREVESLRQKISALEFERRIAIRQVLKPEQRLPYEQYIQKLVQQQNANRPENSTTPQR